MELKWKQCESLLARMAKSMGCTLKAVPENCPGSCLIRAHWYIARSGAQLTVEYYSPKELFGRMLDYYQGFNICGRVVDNPFYGMSPEEAKLRLAVLGA